MADIKLARETLEHGETRLVVLKKIRPNLAKEKKFLEMFLDEARLSTLFDHPNVVRAFEFGSQDKQFYIVMEYLDGESLAFLVSKSMRTDTPLPPSLAAGIAAQACDGLHYAHGLRDDQGKALNIIHRDISPQNIIVLFDGTVKVLDFGIARARDRIHQTRTGITKGKAAYMSPEQCLGKKMDGRSDLFALGIVLWEVLAGRRLFKRPQEMETLRAVVRDETPAIRDFRPEVPPALEAIVLRSLAKDPDQRFSDAGEMSAALRGFLEREDLEAGPKALGVFCQRVMADRIATRKRLIEGIDAGQPAAPEEMTALKPDTDIALPSSSSPAQASLEDEDGDAPQIEEFDDLLDPEDQTQGDDSDSQQDILAGIQSAIAEGATTEMSAAATPLDLTDQLADMDEADSEQERARRAAIVGEAAGAKAVLDLGAVPEFAPEDDEFEPDPALPGKDTIVEAVPADESGLATRLDGQPLNSGSPEREEPKTTQTPKDENGPAARRPSRRRGLLLGLFGLLAAGLIAFVALSGEVDSGQARDDLADAGRVPAVLDKPADPTVSPAADAGEEAAADADKKPAADADKKPAADADKKPAADADKKPAADAGEEPAADAGEEPAADAGEEPTADAGEEPAADADEEPTADAGEEPTADAGEEPTADAGEEPTADAGPSKAWASVRSKPEGCRVRLDGVWLDQTTPIDELELTAEVSHEVAVDCKDHKRAMQQIEPRPDQVLELSFEPAKLRRASTGRLRLNTEPWTEVFFKGRSLGITPLLGVRLPPGEHELKLVNKEMKIDRTLKIRIRADRTTNIFKRF